MAIWDDLPMYLCPWTKKTSGIVLAACWTYQVPGLHIFMAMNLTPLGLTKEDRKCSRKYELIHSGEVHMLQLAYAEQKVWNFIQQQVRHPWSHFISIGSLERLNQEKNMQEKEMSFLPCALWSCLASKTSPPLPMQPNRICASLPLRNGCSQRKVREQSNKRLEHACSYFWDIWTKQQAKRRQKPTLWKTWHTTDLGSPYGEKTWDFKLGAD